MTNDKPNSGREMGGQWRVLRNFKSGSESFREGESLSFLGEDPSTGELSFRSGDGALKKWGLRKGLADYSSVVFDRDGGLGR